MHIALIDQSFFSQLSSSVSSCWNLQTFEKHLNTLGTWADTLGAWAILIVSNDSVDWTLIVLHPLPPAITSQCGCFRCARHSGVHVPSSALSSSTDHAAIVKSPCRHGYLISTVAHMTGGSYQPAGPARATTMSCRNALCILTAFDALGTCWHHCERIC